jgi:gamma-glutamylcyclotransferase (GGCT)/AIG2-like uncharacterized protein YtfP
MIFRMHVFTYGTLMFPEVWKIVVGREFDTVKGAAAGFAIFRVGDAVYPGIAASNKASIVPGIVYLDVDAAAIKRLDRFEGEYYERQRLAVDCADGERRKADAYIIPPRNRHVLTAEPWTAESFVTSGGLAEFIERYQGFSWLRDDACDEA